MNYDQVHVIVCEVMKKTEGERFEYNNELSVLFSFFIIYLFFIIY
jgi:hypothetical protein